MTTGPDTSLFANCGWQIYVCINISFFDLPLINNSPKLSLPFLLKLLDMYTLYFLSLNFFNSLCLIQKPQYFL